MNISQPIASHVSGVGFAFLSTEEVRAISVKRIQNPETFDSLLHPTPGGLYDSALGAWGDNVCSTCHLGIHSCPGHPGHIELPVPVYHVTLLDQLMLLLRGQCAYCHHFKLPKPLIHKYICKLRLLRFGLINEAKVIEDVGLQKSFSKGSDDESTDDDAEASLEALTTARNKFVKKAIKAVGYKQNVHPTDIKFESVARERHDTIKGFLMDITKPTKCAQCGGKSPKFRKDKYNKIFKVALSVKDRVDMATQGKKIQDALLIVADAKRAALKAKLEDREADEGIEMDDASLQEEQDDIEMLEADAEQAFDNNLVDDAANAGSSSQNPVATQDKASSTFVNPEEVYALMSILFDKEYEILDLIYNSKATRQNRSTVSADMFFLRNLLIPPNRYRPEAKTGAGAIAEAEQNSLYKKILNASIGLHQIRLEIQGKVESQYRKRDYDDFQIAWVGLQDAVNSLLDADRNPIALPGNLQHEEGIKQKLEKKEGLFRKNMMGKRVNFAARSVISPDPNIETNEIGVPPVFAKKLTYPEPVTNHNFYELKEAVLNGPEKWPGAAAIENENGQVINLRNKSFDERQALANQLLAPSSVNVSGARNKKVHRHLNNGDIVIMNRQPTLHKPSMMCHRARVLPGERTIRMHYANCNTYNADFDGDEMNMHFPQNESARSEALTVADTDHQYLVATSGKPLRGLIQDHISMGVWLTNRDTFFTRGEYQQLLYSSLRPENNHTTKDRILLVEPAILKPQAMWTGKQVVTTVLKNIKPESHPGLTLNGESQTAAGRWSSYSEEATVIFQDGDFLCGILDKAHLGPSNGGFVHSVYEVYGHTAAGKLLSIIGRLLTKLLHMRAFSCGMEDIALTDEGNKTRISQLKDANTLGLKIASDYVTLENVDSSSNSELLNRLEDVLRDDNKQAGLDTVYNSRTKDLSSQITDACIPHGLLKSFPGNQMQLMTTTGAKGSSVNANLISCNLGQQVLEGRRVPIMVSGKSLPAFKPFETKIRAGGYVTDRFLTGVRPQEYYFHTMAGREGLIDTAVKTARSGYLQRCLIKGMEGLRVEYDTSVRDSDGSMVQFLYGEDGLDVTKQKHLLNFKFLAENFFSVFAQLNVQEGFSRIFSEEADEWNKTAMKKFKKTGNLGVMDPAISQFNPASSWGSTSEAFSQALRDYSKDNPHKLLKDKKVAPDATLSKKNFSTLMNMKYMRSVVDAGEAVGIVAGQSIGEPSTQMTLNTFHLAGHAAKNVTLGIPRLKEILQNASAEIMTPAMTLFLNPEVGKDVAEKFAKGISKLTLAEIVDSVQVKERIGKSNIYDRGRIYDVRLNFFPSTEYCETYAIQVADVLSTLEHKLIPLLDKILKADMRGKGAARALKNAASQPEIGKAAPRRKEAATDDDDEPKDADKAARHDLERAEVNSEDEENPDDDATQFKEKNRGANAYDNDDEDDNARGREGSAELQGRENGEDDDEGYVGSPQPEDSDSGANLKVGKKAKDREMRIKDNSRFVSAFSFDDEGGAWAKISFEFDISTAKILMLNHVENACRKAVIQFIPGIGACTVGVEEVRDAATKTKIKHPVILTSGVNLLAMRDYQDVIDPHRIFANDVAAVLRLYGVEAARATVVRELDAVFKGHSITVDQRHLNLIADMMTREGGFTPFSRYGMSTNTSPFMKMSFETTVRFLKDAVVDGDWDDLRNPSARIVTGRASKVGTGAFDVLMPVKQTA